MTQPSLVAAIKASLPLGRIRSISTTVVDQGMVSAGTFVANIVLARSVLPRDYGVFVLSYSVINFCTELQNALLLEPMMVFGPAKRKEAQAGYLGAVAKLQAVFMMALALLVWLGCLAWYLSGRAGPALGTVAMMGFGVLGIQAREFTRKAFYTALAPEAALRNDALYLVVLLAGLWVTAATGHLSGATTFAVMAVAGLLTSVIGLARAGVRWTRDPAAQRAAVLSHWAYGRWMIGVTAARWSANELYFFVAAIFVGTAGTGALKAVQNVFAPVAMFVTGLGNLFLPVASRLAQDPSITRLNRFSLAVGALLAPMVTAYVIAVMLGSEQVFGVLYKGQYEEFAYLLPLLGIGQVLVAAFQGPALGLRALDRPRAVFFITTISASVTVLAVVPLTARWGLAGAVSAMLLSLLVGSPLWAMHYLRAARERTASVRPI